MGRRVWLAAGLAVLGLVWIGVAVGLRVVHAGEVLPGTRMADIDLGGTTEEEARPRLGAAARADVTVTLVDGPRRFRVRGSDAGYRLDVPASTARAMAAGRRGPLSGLWSTVTGLWTPRIVPPVYTAKPRPLEAVVASIARRLDRPTFPGAISTEPDTLRTAVVRPRPGREVDRDATAAALLDALRRGDGAAATIGIRSQPAVDLDDVRAVAEDAERYLTTPLQLSPGDDPAEVAPRLLAPVLGLESEGLRVWLGVKREPLARLVAKLAARRNREPIEARIVAPARPVILDEQLDLSWRPRRTEVRVVPGRTGRVVRQRAAMRAIATAVRNGRHAARLPMRAVPASLPTESARKVTSLIGTFTTSFLCCQPRVRNIRVIAEAVDGIVVAPGAPFSLNRTAGPRTRAKGYVSAPFIADGGQLVPSVGGGVSQMSTTMYNAAYFAGLHLDAHQPHSLYIERYPPGREATLDYPGIDLRWTNDTSAPVLVRATTTATSVTVSLYGDNGGRRVNAVSGPRQPLAGRDFAITVARNITYPGGRTTREPYTTQYDKPPGG